MRAMRAAVLITVVGLAASSGGAQPRATSCIHCHAGDMFEPAARVIVQKFHDDVHAQAGLSCHDCHGGNPDPKVGEDVAASMDSNFAVNPFIGVPKRAEIPASCGRCHRSAVAEYWTSVHGQRLRRGDEKVATCVDCHSIHDIRRNSNPDSAVYPTHVAETCSRCHSDSKRMTGYAIPTDQYARWRVSMHANALLAKDDLTAPTCNDCHGNHGATPPGVESASLVCANCHAREAELFRKSSKAEGWKRHDELLATGAKCGDCHADQRAKLDIHRFGECVTCHENHSVVRPSVALVGMLPDTPCAFCHEGTGPLAGLVEEPKAKATHYREMRGNLLNVADRLRLHGDARFDWLVDQAQQLPAHRLAAGRPDEKAALRPEFARLFEKFRVGKTRYTFRGAANQEIHVTVRRCSDCHGPDDPKGMASAKSFLAATRGLTSMIGRAERMLLAAHRGGVEVRAARAELDGAVGNQIELETAVHTFGTGDDIRKKQDEGLQHARAALLAGQGSLDELAYRRTGLLAALGIIILVLIALALKIRTLP